MIPLRRATAILVLVAMASCGPRDGPPGTAVPFSELPGFATDDLAAALVTFRTSCVALTSGNAPRIAKNAPSALVSACNAALALPEGAGSASAKSFFEAHFVARKMDGPAFFTGYYEPVVEGSLEKTTAFPTPLYGRPPDLVGGAPGQKFTDLDPTLTAARRLARGGWAAMPDRAAIENGALQAAPFDQTPLVFVKDAVEAFFIQVQGSARIELPDGTLKRLIYAGRNGYPYTSIGKVLVDEQHIPPAQMGMTQLKTWIRDHGLGLGGAGTLLMQRNRSYIFFAFDDALPSTAGPIGGSGVSLTPLRSLAVDRTLWSYGLPMYVDAELPGANDRPAPFQHLMVAQDTGSAIIGPTRADIFFGTGPDAAAKAGGVRHKGTLYVLWPKDAATAP